MKIISLITITLFLSLGNIFSQDLPGVTNRGFTLKTTRKGESSPAPIPSENSLRYKCIIPELKANAFINLYMKEYVDGNEIADNISTIIWGPIEKEKRTTISITPDLENSQLLKLFVDVPGFHAFRSKQANEKSVFKVCRYDNFHDGSFDTNVPFLLIYEDNKENPEMEVFVSKQLKKGVLSSNLTQNQKTYSKIKRYFLIYYTLKNTEN